jgi:hypothetical protein
MKFQISQASDCWSDTVGETVKEAFKDGDDWFVEITTIQELISFQEKYGDIVIRNNLLTDNKEIVLYDDYLES